MGHTFEQLWDLVDEAVTAEGLELYDIERAVSGAGKSAGGNSTGKGRRASFGKGGAVRVYIVRATVDATGAGNTGESSDGSETSGSSGAHGEENRVTIDDCANVSRRLSAFDRFEEFLGENSVLEVSSPGINRKLRTFRHFQHAVGERVAITFYDDATGKDRSVKGTLERVDGEPEVLHLREEQGGGELSIAFCDVSKARIDFDFSKPQKNQPQQKGKKR
ncbi:ribosome maturation factor RimP [bacterium]|nr:ribosome maturation factor RimP [bacterium]